MKTIEIDPKRYDELMAVSVWYDGMPTDTTFKAGDRFHENVWDFRMSCIPDDAIGEGQWLDYFELVGDELFAIVGQEDGSDEVEYKIVPKA